MKIFVNLQSLWNSSKEMDSSGSQIQSAGSTLSGAGSGAPSYEGQFAPWVQGIASDANGRSKQMASGVLDLGFRVGKKANEFQAADQAGLAGISSAGQKQLSWTEQNALMSWIAGLFGRDWFKKPSFSLLPWVLLPGFIITRPGPGPWWRPGPFPWPWWPPKVTPRWPPSFWPKPIEPVPPSKPIFPPEKPLPIPAAPKPQPVPLAETDAPTSGGSCAIYAQKRRPDLGPVGKSGNGNTGAGNYIHKYKDKVFHTSRSDDLTKKIAPGYALVWEIGHPQADATYGHIAIVEEVGPDYVWISQAGSSPTRMKLSREFVSTLYVLP